MENITYKKTEVTYIINLTEGSCRRGTLPGGSVPPSCSEWKVFPPDHADPCIVHPGTHQSASQKSKTKPNF